MRGNVTNTQQGESALNILLNTEAFRTVPQESLQALANRGRWRRFLPNAIVMKQGDASHALHILVKGKVRVERETSDGKTIVLADLEPGEVVGEMGVLDGRKRSATVIALENVETFELSAAVMKAVFAEYPEALAAIMRIVTQRLHNTDELVAKSVEIALHQLQND